MTAFKQFKPLPSMLWHGVINPGGDALPELRLPHKDRDVDRAPTYAGQVLDTLALMSGYAQTARLRYTRQPGEVLERIAQRVPATWDLPAMYAEALAQVTDPAAYEGMSPEAVTALAHEVELQTRGILRRAVRQALKAGQLERFYLTTRSGVVVYAIEPGALQRIAALPKTFTYGLPQLPEDQAEA